MMVKRIFPWKIIFALFVHDALFRETIRMKIVKNVNFDISKLNIRHITICIFHDVTAIMVPLILTTE